MYEGDLYEPLPATLRDRVDVLVANAPYVPTEAIGLLPPQARIHDPRVALDGGADGLDVQRRVTAAAPLWLEPGGYLLVETSERQAPQTVETFASNGLIPQVAGSDELNATVVVGTRPPTRSAVRVPTGPGVVPSTCARTRVRLEAALTAWAIPSRMSRQSQRSSNRSRTMVDSMRGDEMGLASTRPVHNRL